MKSFTKVSQHNNGNEMATLRNYEGGVQPILTVPYRGGEGGSKIRKIALRNL